MQIPQCLTNDICLVCNGCCRFASQDSCWRPKAEMGSYQSIFDAKRYLHTKNVASRDVCYCLNVDDNICDIYESRPFECRLYPFLLVKKDDVLFLGIHLSCPYVLDHRYQESFESTINEMRSFFQKEDVKLFLSQNEFLANDYSQHLNEIEFLFAL